MFNRTRVLTDKIIKSGLICYKLQSWYDSSHCARWRVGVVAGRGERIAHEFSVWTGCFKFHTADNAVGLISVELASLKGRLHADTTVDVGIHDLFV